MKPFLQLSMALCFFPLLMGATSDPTESINKVLNDFHQAASNADGKRYFGHFSKNGVFLGTDASERWTVSEFKKYAEPHFSKGQGWTYISTKRNVDLSPDGTVAWFDEILENKSFGITRGSGVLVKKGSAWKISQYHLTIPVPNGLAKQLVKMIKEQPKSKP